MSAPDDAAERSAEASAEEAVRRDRSSGQCCSSCAAGGGCDGHGSRPSGAPLDTATRLRFESSMGAQLSGVRVHTDAETQRTAAGMRAAAFTVGNDIGFAAGRYAPATPGGRRLIAHELAHVLQQSGRPVGSVVQRAPEEPGRIVVSVPGPAPERDRAPLTPDPSLERFWFRGVLLAADRPFLRGELERLIAREGLRGAADWVAALHGHRDRTIGLPFSAHTAHLPAMRPRTALDVQREMDSEQRSARVLPVVRPLVDELWAQLYVEAARYLVEFEAKAREITLGVLRDSEVRIEAERMRYGVTTETTVRTRRRPTGEGPYETVQEITERHDMDASLSSVGLAGAAADLAAKHREISRLRSERTSALARSAGPRVGPPASAWKVHAELGERIVERERELDVLRAAAEDRYPVLAAISLDRADLARVGAGPSPAAAGVLARQMAERLDNICQVRRELGPSGRVQVWRLPEIVALTKGTTGAAENTTTGRMRSRLVDDKIASVESDRSWTELALAALAIGLAIVAAIPTGGSSLVAGVGAVAAIGSFGLSVTLAVGHLREFQLDSALAGTDFDRARAISAEEPSLFWLAVDILGALADIGPALRGTRTLLTAGRRAFSTLTPAVRRAIRSTSTAAADLAEVHRIAAGVEHGGPALTERVVSGIERARRAGGDVRGLAGAAGHEAAAVERASAQLTQAAEHGLASAPTRVGGHTVTLLPDGRIVMCSTCTLIREQFAVEFTRSPFLARRWFEIRDLAEVAARTGDAAAAERVAIEARELVDHLEMLRRTRDVRLYRGLRSGQLDDLFLMDARLVVDMKYVGVGVKNATSAGWLRDQKVYWDELRRRYPAAISTSNAYKIDVLGLAPVNDAQFRSVFTQYAGKGLWNDTLIHHHIGGGGQAAAVPASLHPGFGGIHNAEKAAGIWNAENPWEDVLRRLLTQGEGSP